MRELMIMMIMMVVGVACSCPSDNPKKRIKRHWAKGHYVVCLEGVQYWKQYLVMSPRLDRSGKVIFCEDGEVIKR